ncbi:MAG: hypothetical protein IJV92_04370, partial [Phascolarctobacterium sp.]|nr:hypothetical protein [Phascolarctobacterium sp.]
SQPVPQVRPSNQTLTINPQKHGVKNEETLKLDPQKLWQTLKKFDYPKKAPQNAELCSILFTFKPLSQ